MEYVAHDYQAYATNFIENHPIAAVLLDMGMGKSVITLTALNVEATLWHHHGTNMIDWIMDTSKGDEAVWQSVNHTEINSTGFEASARLNVSCLMFHVSYSYINQDKKQEEGIVSQYALEYLRHKLVGNLRLQLTRHLDLGLIARWQDRVGSYTDFDGHVQDYQPYFLTDARP